MTALSGLASTLRHTDGSAPRGSTLGGPGPARWRWGGAACAAAVGPERSTEAHLRYSRPTHTAQFSDHPGAPCRQRATLTPSQQFPIYQSVAVLRAPGLCSSRPESHSQSSEPDEPPNYKAHDTLRPVLHGARLSRFSSRGAAWSWQPRLGTGATHSVLRSPALPAPRAHHLDPAGQGCQGTGRGEAGRR